MEEILIKTTGLVVFSLDEQRYALHLDAVEKIVRAVALTALPQAPAIVMGIMDLRGEIIPVINIRKRFLLPERELGPGDQFIVASAGSLTVALVVDEVHGIIEPEQGMTPPDAIAPGLDYIAGVTRNDDGMILIHDLDTFLSLEEEKSLAISLEQIHA